MMLQTVKHAIRRALQRVRSWAQRRPPFKADRYWEQRYAAGGDSGSGSQGEHYAFKRDYINDVVQRYGIGSIIDFGCGDGGQVEELRVKRYYGIDVSPSAVQKCRERYRDRPNFAFDVASQARVARHDMAMSLDVIYHVTDRHDYAEYVDRLFACGRFVLLYASYGVRESNTPHMVFRDNMKEIASRVPSARLIEKRPHPTKRDFGFALFEVAEPVSRPGATSSRA